jgi:hypothetical protein
MHQIDRKEIILKSNFTVFYYGGGEKVTNGKRKSEMVQ